jgi:acylglycerol lipase
MIHQEGALFAKDGLKLYYQSWKPRSSARGALIVVHGLFEHCGRYRVLSERLARLGYAVYTSDLRGHGLTQGKRVWVKSFADYIDDLDMLASQVQTELPSTKIFILGHCMGSLIAIQYILRNPLVLSGLVVSAPLLKLPCSLTPSTLFKARMFGNLPLLSSRIRVSLFNEGGISRSQRVVKDYLEDSLVFHQNVSARLGLAVLRQMRVLQVKLSEISLPMLAMHGVSDLISDVESSRILYCESSSTDKTIRLYDGVYHDIFNDPGHERVFADLEEWLATHTSSPVFADQNKI